VKKKVKRYKYLKGKFFGKYRGSMTDQFFGTGPSYRFDFYDCSITDCRVFETEEEVKPPGGQLIEQAVIRDIHIELVDERGNKSYYKDDLEQVKIWNYTFTDVVKDGSETYGTVRGEVIASLGYIEEVEVEVEKVAYDPTRQPGFKTLKRPGYAGQENYAGCANILSSGIFGLLGFALLAIVKFRGAAIVLLVLGAIWLLFYILTRIPKAGNAISAIIGLVFIGALLTGVYFMFSGVNHYRHYSDYGEVPEWPDYHHDEAAGPDTVVTHELTWYNYDWSKKFTGSWKVHSSDYRRAHDAREGSYNPLLNNDEWCELYTALYNGDRLHMDSIYRMFKDIGQKKKLNRRQFLDMVVCCVQNIRYAKVIEGNCGLDDEYRQSKLYSWEDTIGCLGYCKYGIQSPNEFAYNLQGDCDTRTVFLYTVLTHFKYDVVVFCSLEYAHSVLGVNIPASGVYKTVHNKKYYLWETTYPDWTVGNVSPEMTDTYFWHVFMPLSKM
jgi:hypothetical protein